MINLLFMLMPLHARNVEISYFQSDSNSKIEWVVVDDCAVQIEKAKMRDECYVLKKVNDFCHLDLDLKECK